MKLMIKGLGHITVNEPAISIIYLYVVSQKKFPTFGNSWNQEHRALQRFDLTDSNSN